MKNKRKRQFGQVLAILLCVCMITPDVAPIVSYAAETIENMPRYVNFSRPKALMLSDLGLSTDSNAGFEEVIPEEEPPEKTETGTEENVLNNKVQSGGIQDDWILDEDELDGTVHVATDSDAEIRDPEFFYEDFPEEPDGVLVDFSETSRTYLMEENIGVDETGEPIHSYVTIVGDSPYLYQTEDGTVQYYDNTLRPVSHQTKQISVASDSNIASGSNARRARKTSKAVTVTNYQNAEGRATIQIPDEMDSGNGYMISHGEDTIEIIPTEGEFKSSVTLENVIRYSNVFENVDFQYTVVGDSIKEDIILLGRQERNEFSYKLKSTGLKYKKINNSVVAYKESYRKPIFRLTAPVMVDAAGVPSVDINVKFNSSSNEITFIADKDWLDDPERVYPVRIDPGATLVGYDAFSVNMVAKGDKPEFLGTGEYDEGIYNTSYGDDGHTMVGYSKDHGHCRAMILVDTEWEKLINHSATQVDGPGVKKVQMSFGVMTNDSPQRTPFILRVMDEPWDTSKITFANVCHKKSTQTGDAQYSNGINSRLEFDITDTYYQWVNGTKPRYGLMMEVEGENDYNPQNLESVWWAETLYNKNGAGNGPRIEVAWEGKLENVEDLSLLPMSEFSLDVGPGVIESEEGGRSTKGILAHGASQAGSSIDYQIYKKSGNEVIAEGSVEAHDEVDCPDYTEVDGDCIWEDHQDSNWQSDPVLYDADLELDTIYYAKAKGTGYEIVEDPETGEPMQGENEEESEELTSDEFLLYEVQATDIIPRIARHYGVPVETLKEDNKFHEQLTVTGDVLFIRNPQTDEPYTRRLTPDELEELLLECLSLGMDYRDFFGMEPVNMANGSFYMNQTDASIDDLGGPFNIERSYNSVTPYFRSDFGMGWSSLTNEKIMVLPGSTIIYVREDGKGLVFEKSGDKTYRAPEGYDYELEAIDSIEMKTEDSDDASDTGEEGAEEEAVELQDMGATPSSVARKKAAKQKAFDTDSGESEGTETEAEETKVPASTGWQITQPDGTVKVFNSNGLLVTEKDRQGRTTYYLKLRT